MRVIVRVRQVEVQQACSALASSRRKRQSVLFFDKNVLLTVIQENKERLQNVSCLFSNLDFGLAIHVCISY